MKKRYRSVSQSGNRLKRAGNHRRGSAKSLVAVLIAAAAVGGVGYYWYQSKSTGIYATSDGKPMLEEVAQAPFDHVVLEQGEIESSSNNEVKCEVKGRGSSGTPILNVVAEGTIVKKGDKLCQLDSSALEQDAKTQRIVVSAAESTVISSQATVSKAEIARQEYLEGTYLTERKAIISEISVAQQNVRKAELALQSAERLAAKGTYKPLQIEAEQFSVENARSTLDSAEGRLKVLDQLTKAKMLVQLDSDIATAKAKLDSDLNTLAEEKDKLEEIQSQIKACTVLAPADGQVVYANKFGSRGGADFVVEPGAVVREQQTIFLLPDPSRMQVKAKINESRVTLIREGMPVKIRVGAVENELLGRVVKVNKYAEPGNWFGSNVKEYAAFVQIIDPPETIRTGMTAEVRIFVEQLPDAIQVPVLAVYETKRHHFVLVKKGDDFETKEIKIGGTNEKFVTAESGVDVGDMVVLNPRKHLNKMEIPEIEEVDDRDKLAKIASEPRPVGKDSGRPEGGASGGGGGMNPEAIVGMIMGRVDTNSDGKISKDEASADENMKKFFDESDSNKDGSLDRAELTANMKKRMANRGSGAGGPGGGPGAGGPPGPRGGQ
ncbi:MAG: HlyD family efflux transporter periplasmic adaptor subunit [Pirellula sp.]|jgi:RND family efflux transporter MFP subunit|nr:HlyD family efflux transporter periplasmic adaptor subunit [Pirellula sp.]